MKIMAKRIIKNKDDDDDDVDDDDEDVWATSAAI